MYPFDRPYLAQYFYEASRGLAPSLYGIVLGSPDSSSTSKT